MYSVNKAIFVLTAFEAVALPWNIIGSIKFNC